MGSGVSSNFGDSGGGDFLAATFLIGQAIAAISFPGMFRIYDFHSRLAPRIKAAASPFSMFGMGDDSDDDDDEKNPADYEHFFHVKVGDDTVYIEDPLGENDLQWTPLHTCCMSFVTVQAGLALIEEYERSGASLEMATLAGPGTFNSRWTALHMACAYGVEPLVERLVRAGANVNTRNSFGYTPLIDSITRGYLNVVSMLLASGKVDLGYIPDENLALSSPMVTSPPQSPLAEAARSGFQKIVQMILDQGCPKDLANKLGWTALHEACFFNRIQTVKTLLLAGCRGDLRTRAGALPYHLASIKQVREMIEDMGCPGSVPKDSTDVIDMVQVLRELTSMGQEEEDDDNSSDRCDRCRSNTLDVDDSLSPQAQTLKLTSAAEVKKPTRPRALAAKASEVETEEKEAPMIHKGGVLGDLPSFVSPGKKSPDKNTLSKHSKAAIDGAGAMLTAEGKQKASRGAAARIEAPKDVPPEFVCELCRKIMSDPVKSVYGNMFEATVINRWLKEQGRICPLTGAPLAETDLTPADELRETIQKWVLQKSQGGSRPADTVPNAAAEGASVTAGAKGKSPVADSNDDLYDF